MNDLVSVVVPIYNVRDYLEECLDSIISQSYRNMEIILVDDGSTDGSSELCDIMQKKDDRIRVIHKNNGGLSDARNTGLKNSTGEYVIFIDSDDTIKKTMLKKMVEAIEKNNADIAACAFKTFTETRDNDNDNDLDCNCRNICCEGSEVVKSLYQGRYQNIAFVAWNKLYRRRLFIDYNIIYPVGRLYEDTFTTYKLLYNSKKVVLLTNPLYNYRIRSGSIMKSSVNLRKTRDWFDSEKDAVEYFDMKYESEIMSLAANSFFRAQIKFYKKMDSNTPKECKAYLIDQYCKAFKYYARIMNLPIHKKIIYGLFSKFPDLISKIY